MSHSLSTTEGSKIYTYLLTIKNNVMVHKYRGVVDVSNEGKSAYHTLSTIFRKNFKIIANDEQGAPPDGCLELDSKGQLHYHSIIRSKRPLNFRKTTGFFRSLKSQYPTYKSYNLHLKEYDGQDWEHYLTKQDEAQVLLAYKWLTATINSGPYQWEHFNHVELFAFDNQADYEAELYYRKVFTLNTKLKACWCEMPEHLVFCPVIFNGFTFVDFADEDTESESSEDGLPDSDSDFWKDP